MMKGLDKVLRNLEKEKEDMNNKSYIAVRKAAEFVLDKAIPLTPMSPLGSKTSGNLRRSGKTKVVNRNGEKVGIITFGGGEVSYALRIHEAPSNWNWSEPGTGPKYLERPLRENVDKVKKIISTELKR